MVYKIQDIDSLISLISVAISSCDPGLTEAQVITLAAGEFRRTHLENPKHAMTDSEIQEQKDFIAEYSAAHKKTRARLIKLCIADGVPFPYFPKEEGGDGVADESTEPPRKKQRCSQDKDMTLQYSGDVNSARKLRSRK